MKEPVFHNKNISHEDFILLWNTVFKGNPYEHCHGCGEELEIRLPVPEGLSVFCQDCIDISI